MKTIKTVSFSNVIVPPQHVDSHKLLKFPIFSFFIILITIFLLAACPGDPTYDNVPDELQGTWSITSSAGSITYNFTATSWSRKDSTSNFTVSDLRVTPIKNKDTEAAQYPSGYEILGKVISSSGDSPYSVGKMITYNFYLSTDKKKIHITWYTDQ